jgi:hypothetical protein
MSIERERADDGSFILKIKLPPGVEPPRDLARARVIAHNVRQVKQGSGASLERWLAHEA